MSLAKKIYSRFWRFSLILHSTYLNRNSIKRICLLHFFLSCSVANTQIHYQGYPFRRRMRPFQILHETGFSSGWESRLGEHQIHSETSGHLIKLAEEIQDGRFIQALNWSLYTGGAPDQQLLLKGTRAVSFIKTGVHNHGFEEPLSVEVRKLTFVIRMRCDSYANSWRKLKLLKNRKLLADSLQDSFFTGLKSYPVATSLVW